MKEGKSMEKAAADRYKAGEQMIWRDPQNLPDGMSGYIETYPLTREAFISGAKWQSGQQEGWIRVEDGLPEGVVRGDRNQYKSSEWVLVSSQLGYYEISLGMYDYHAKGWFDNYGANPSEDGHIKFWKPVTPPVMGNPTSEPAPPLLNHRTTNQNKEMKHVFELLKAEIWRYEKSIQVLSALVKATDDEGLLESLLRDEEYHHQFKRAYEILLNSEPNDAVSDTTKLSKERDDGQTNEFPNIPLRIIDGL